MQRHASLLLLVALTAGLSSCARRPSAPIDVAKAFVAALIKGDNDATKKLLSKKALKKVEADPQLKDKVAEMLQSSVGLTSAEQCSNEKINGERATVECPTTSGQLSVPLVKEDGEWKVHPPFADRE